MAPCRTLMRWSHSMVVLGGCCSLWGACSAQPASAPIAPQAQRSDAAAGPAVRTNRPEAGTSTPRDDDAAEEAGHRGVAPIDERPCPPDMTIVQGLYCPRVEQRCLGYLDPPGRYHEYRCRQYAEPASCDAERVAMRFCIDSREYTPPGHRLPAHFVSFTDAKRVCEASGKRLCLESEWTFACEGEQMRPYPYGFARDASACHADRTDLWEADGRTVRDQRVPSGQFERCASPFGVFDLAGNLEEFVASDEDRSRPVMKGAWWLPGRNHCRARQTFHNAAYKGVETGFRCCADPARTEEAPDQARRVVNSAPPPTDGCVTFRQAPAGDGAVLDCYPYRCRNGRCLKRCAGMQDCAGASRPDQLEAYGYPLECMPSGACVPMPPWKVDGPGH